MTTGASQRDPDLIVVQVPGLSRRLTRGEWLGVAYLSLFPLGAAALLLVGWSFSTALLTGIVAVLTLPVVLIPFRRPVGAIRFRAIHDGVAFPGTSTLRESIALVSPVLLVGPLEALRLTLTSQAEDTPGLAYLGLWACGPAFVAFRRGCRNGHWHMSRWTAGGSARLLRGGCVAAMDERPRT